MTQIMIFHLSDGPNVKVGDELAAFPSCSQPGKVYLECSRGACLTPEETVEFAKALLEVADYVAETHPVA